MTVESENSFSLPQDLLTESLPFALSISLSSVQA